MQNQIVYFGHYNGEIEIIQADKKAKDLNLNFER